ncbi:MAG: hypothetical protein F2592_02565, partial [Actinobacteria bacterium]|nr:hypothetical protein [Actinomycetota bacterium]
MQICSDEITNLSSQDKKQFDLVWSLSAKLGGPILLALNRIAEVFDGQQRNQREVQLAFAGPQATAKMVMWLPVLALML